MDVKTNDINNVGTVRARNLEGTLASSVQGNITDMPGLVSINGKGVPSSDFVGVSDAQTLTNKTIDGSQIVDQSLALGKIAPVTALSLVGNPIPSSATPEAVSMATVKIMGNLVDAAILNSWTGSSTVSTLSSTVNGLTLPSSNFVGVSDAQTLTNKTIDGSQIVDQSLALRKLAPVTALSLVGNSSASSAVPSALTPAQVKAMLDISDQQAVTLDGDVTGSGTGTVSTIIASNSVSLEKMATLAAKSIIGNSTAVAATPQALSSSSVRSLLSLANVENTALSTWPGSTNITTVAPNSVSLGNMGTLVANTIIGNNTDIAATPQALSVTDVKSLLALDNVENTTLSTWAGSTNITTIGSLTTVNTSSITSPGNLTITPNFGAGNVQIWSPLDMNTNSISNVGTLNALTLPISNLVGVNDAQTLTNKTIDSCQIVNSSMNGSQIVYQSLPLDKVIPLSAFTLIGNNTEASAAPTALTSFEAKTLLALNNVENTALSTWNGSNNITTLGTISTLNVSNINSSGTLAITPSGGASSVEIWGPLDMKTNSISNVGTLNAKTLPSSNLVGISDVQTLTNKTIDASQIVNASIVASKLADGSVTASKIASGVIPSFPTSYMFRRKEATQNISTLSGIYVVVSFPTAVSSNNITYTSTGSDFYATVAEAGRYVVQWALTWNYAASQTRVDTYVQYSSATANTRHGYMSYGSGSSNDHAVSSCAVLNLVANDAVRVWFMHNHTGNLVNNPAINEWGYLNIVRIQ
jgi:hypothetical protein